MAKIKDIALLERMISNGYISKKPHPHYPLYILNYTESCRLEKAWNDITMSCRGMIIDKDYNIISRPYVKFFNYEEIEDKSSIPDLPFKIYEKIDGTLGISYIYNGEVFIATRGSFTSEQANWANKWLHNNCPKTIKTIEHNPNFTFLFEIVYPEDRKVVNYNGLQCLYLTGVIDTDCGNEIDIDNFRFLSDEVRIAKSYDGISDWRNVRDLFSGDNMEGFVVKFQNNYRVKMKYESWFRLNFVKSKLSEKYILECIINGELLEAAKLISEMDEETQIYFKDIVFNLYNEYNEIMLSAMLEYRDFETDKEAAAYFNTCKYSPILFSMRKEKDYSGIIWKMIKQRRKLEKEE